MKRWGLPVWLLLWVSALLLGSMLIDRTLERWRIDLTAQRVHTLNEGTRRLMHELEQPVRLRLYFSEQESGDLPLLRHFAQRVQRLIGEMSRHAAGLIELEVIDPQPFSEQEDAALLAGLDAVPTGRGNERVFLGLVGQSVSGFEEVLPFIPPGREPFLEYELARMIHVLGRAEAPRVGLLTRLPLAGRAVGWAEFDQPAWVAFEQLNAMFDLVSIDPDGESLPADLDALLIIHPHDFNDSLLAAIEHYLRNQGPTLLMLDPWSEFGDVMVSDLGGLFNQWGLTWQRGAFVADPQYGLQIALGAEQLAVRHPAVLGLSGSAINREDPMTAELEAVNMASAGQLTLRADSTLTLEPLLWASAQAAALPVERLRDQQDLAEALRAMAVELAQASPGPERPILAARLTGPLPSNDMTDPPGWINALVFADSDWLADRYWVNRRSMLGTTLTEPFADNGALLVNAVDHLLGGSALMSVRSRGVSLRPFILVDSLRREAEQRLVGAEQRLINELNAIEQGLEALRAAEALDDDAARLALAEALEQRAILRQSLRQVRRDLDRDIERLGTRVRTLNVLLMPALVLVLAAFMAWRRQRALRWSLSLPRQG